MSFKLFMPHVFMEKSASRAFIPYPEVPVEHASKGPLSGLRFAVKDLYDVKGYPTSAGNPMMLARSGIKTATAPAIQKLLDAGAAFVGKTVTDELAYSMAGSNAHFGAPVNGGAPGRLTGGSSSGSASAVSCGLADFAIGSDTGGSVRCPASQCGLFGIRPTHGVISLNGCQPLSPSFDTLGWFARDIDVFARVGSVLFGREPKLASSVRLIAARDVMTLFGREVDEALAPAYERAQALFGAAQTGALAPLGFDGDFASFRRIQAQEAWSSDGEFIEACHPVLGPGVSERFAFAKEMSSKDLSADEDRRSHVREALSDALGSDGIMMLPTMPGAGPLRSSSEAELESFRREASLSFCHGGLSGFPWITIPAGEIEGAPIGLSLIGPEGSDLRLIAAAQAFVG